MKADDCKVKCPECGYEDYPRITKSYEQDDRDGNRGIEITFIECANCGADLKGVLEN
jgi:uncharacterized Zn finger protein